MKVLIGTPSARGSFSAGFVGGLVDTMGGLRAGGHEATWSVISQALVSRSRDILASRAIKGEFDYLWMIDDDMSWGQDVFSAFLTLMATGCPIIAVAAPVRQYPVRFPARFVPNSERMIGTLKVREATSVGTGCMAINVGVLRMLSERCATYKGGFDPQDDKTWRFFVEQIAEQTVEETGEKSTILLGEDESFVMMARQVAKVPTIVPVDVLIGHEGMHEFRGRVSDHWDTVYYK